MRPAIDPDAYIAAAPVHLRPILMQVRAQLVMTLPDAQQFIAYNMPCFGFGRSIIAGYAAFSKQCGLYLTHGAIAAHVDDIAAEGLKATKMGVTFSPGKPISNALIAKLALTCREELGL